MIRPLKGNPRITTQFKDPDYGSLGAHLGIDYGVEVGTPVYAPVSGTIAVAKETSGPGSGGKQLELHGDDGRWHRFLHLNDFAVGTHSVVAEGQLLGHSGRTGDVTGPHLHWDVRKANTTWNASLSNYFNPELLITGSADVSTGVSIKMIGTSKSKYNVRSAPNMGNNIRSGNALGGQQYGAVIVEGGWALISFNGQVGYVGPSTFKKL